MDFFLMKLTALSNVLYLSLNFCLYFIIYLVSSFCDFYKEFNLLIFIIF